uniref:EsV-1-7 n=1 Tax=Hanusia phi TaxID=3032 RepID=A0A7S0E1R9_9CRYP|mmetsp:Transcript_15006/g.34523  ORF Transcript_15006/g.34523 Transcript_15006/m.34523 type:complete len:257 (+) Transcript_15006:148-918(+)
MASLYGCPSAVMLRLVKICSLFHILSSASMFMSSTVPTPTVYVRHGRRLSALYEDGGGDIVHVLQTFNSSKLRKRKRVCCLHAGCTRQPSFGSKQSNSPTFCAEHRQPDDIDLRNRRCMYAEGCSRWPFYGDPNDRVKMFCWEHKNGSHVDVVRKRCEHEGCERWPSFAEVGQTSPSFCRQHALACHVDVKHRRCDIQGCNRQPIFGSQRDGRMIHCGRHRMEGEVDLKHLRARRQKGQELTNSSKAAIQQNKLDE